MGNKRHVILHYHLFKNAGSTLVAALERNFGRRFALLHAPQHDQRVSGDALLDFVQAQPSLVAISSHHLSPPPPASDSIRFHDVLILRDPLDRIRSMFDFYRRVPIHDDPLTIEAKRLDARDFVEYVLATRRHLITNAQTNVIANAGHKIPDQADVYRAADIIRSVAVTGVVEMFDICALQAEHRLRPFFPDLDLSYVRENVTPRRGKDIESRLRAMAEALGDGLYQKLAELNKFDMELVNIARAESVRRWEEQEKAQLGLRNFKRRLNQRRVINLAGQQYTRVRRLCQGAAKSIFHRDEGR